MTDVTVFLGRALSPKIPGGVSRIAAVVLFLVAIVCAAAVLIAPDVARWAGLALVLAVGIGAGLLFMAIWPRRSEGAIEARRAADAAAAANVAWAVTARDGSVMDCNVAYRFLAGAGEGEPPAPPQLAFVGIEPSAALYRLHRAAVEGRAREESFETESGQRLSASVRPLKRGESAWWFVPRLPEAAPTKSALAEGKSPSALIRFADFFRHAPVGVAIVGASGAIVESNRAFADFFGSAKLNFGDLVGAEEKDAAIAAIAHAASGANGSEPVEIRSAAAAAKSAQLFASPFAASPDGEPRAILYLVDTSAQKALELQFAQSQKMQAVGQLAGGVAHDFNNLLTVIIGNCELLLMRHPAGDPSFRELNEIHQHAYRAEVLVRQLLAFSRQQTLQPKMLALADTLGELSMLLRRLLSERVALKFEHAPNLWPVMADENQIGNVIINLAVNARDAMPSGGTVTIKTANVTLDAARALGTGEMPAGEYACIEVSDTGHGIAREHLDKIFEPFFTTKPVGQGTGLGLSTVYGIVKQTGGFITVDSEPGKGTRFTIYLPRHIPREGAAEISTVAAAAHAPRDVTGQDTILLVEDEDPVRSFAARALRLRGYNVLEANGGETALEIVRNHPRPIDLLVSDVVMPGMDGPTLVRAARRVRPEMRVLFMSGYAEQAFRKNDQKLDDIDFLPKPFGLKQLAAKVKDVLSAPMPNGGAPN